MWFLASLGLAVASPTLVVEEGSAVVMDDGEVLVNVPLSSPRPDPALEGARFEDRALLVADALVVLRDVHVLGDFCHTPAVREAEIYTANHTLRRVTDPEIASRLQGEVATARDHSWGIVLDEAEAWTYGYSVITRDGQVLYHRLEIPFERRGTIEITDKGLSIAGAMDGESSAIVVARNDWAERAAVAER